MNIEVRYFAALREAAGKSSEQVITSSSNLEALYRELQARHSFPLQPGQLKASRNGQWVGLGAAVQEGDSIVFIPPVAGG